MFFKLLFDPAPYTLTYRIAHDASHETHVHADHVTAAQALKQASEREGR